MKRAAELVESEQRVRRVRSETIPMRFARSADVVKAVGASLTVAAPPSDVVGWISEAQSTNATLHPTIPSEAARDNCGDPPSPKRA